MGSGEACANRVLAKGRTCRVACCTHGTVHLTMGALTLRLSPEQLGELTATLGAALDSLEAPPSRQRLLC